MVMNLAIIHQVPNINLFIFYFFLFFFEAGSLSVLELTDQQGWPVSPGITYSTMPGPFVDSGDRI